MTPTALKCVFGICGDNQDQKIETLQDRTNALHQEHHSNKQYYLEQASTLGYCEEDGAAEKLVNDSVLKALLGAMSWDKTDSLHHIILGCMHEIHEDNTENKQDGPALYQLTYKNQPEDKDTISAQLLDAINENPHLTPKGKLAAFAKLHPSQGSSDLIIMLGVENADFEEAKNTLKSDKNVEDIYYRM